MSTHNNRWFIIGGGANSLSRGGTAYGVQVIGVLGLERLGPKTD